MNVFQNLMIFYNQLPLDSTYRIVAKGILENLDTVSNSTIYEVAELTNSSRTTVWRMVLKMGYKNYTEFRHTLFQAVNRYTYYNCILPELGETNENEIIARFADQVDKARNTMLTDFDIETLIETAKCIYEMDKIHFYFPYQNYAVVSFQQNLAITEKESNYCSLLPDMLENMDRIDEKSIVFIEVIEHPESMDMSIVFEELQRKKAHIYMMSNSVKRYIDYAEKIMLPSMDGIVTNMIMHQMYFLTLSEIYRNRYIKE